MSLTTQIGVIENVDFPEVAIVNTILRGLPQSYDVFVKLKTIEEKLTVEKLSDELIKLSMRDESVKTNDEFSYSAKYRSKKFSEKKFPEKKFPEKKFPEKKFQDNRFHKKEMICFECQKPGHKRSECHSLKKDYKKGYKSKESSAYVAMKEFNFVADYAKKALDKDIWIIDSGASSHICNNKNLFVELSETVDSEHRIGVGNGEKVQVAGKGTVKPLVRDSKGNLVTMTLNNVLYAPGMDGNFISFKKILRMGHGYDFNSNGDMAINVYRKGETIIPTGSQNDIITIEVHGYEEKKAEEEPKLLVGKETGKLELWHKRLGHIGKTSIKQMVLYVDGIDIGSDDQLDCEICAMTKATAKPFTRSESRTTEPLQIVHCDIAGPFRTPTAFTKEKYAIIFIDDYSHEIMVYTMQYKSEALEKFKQYRADVGNMKWSIRCIRTDNGGEFISKKFKQFCKDNGIRQEFTIPHTPQQNGVAERGWRTIFEMARAMLKENNLGDEWWGRAIKTAAYIRNRCLTSATDEKKTPYELCYGKKPDLSELRIFGCQVYAHEPKEKYYKLGDRAKPGFFMDYI